MTSHKPAWWQLYLLVPIMFGLMVLEHLAPLPRVSDQIVDTVIMALTFGAMLLWVKRNAANLEESSLCARPSALSTLKPDGHKPNARVQGIPPFSRDYAPSAIQSRLVRSHRPRRAVRSGRDIRSPAR